MLEKFPNELKLIFLEAKVSLLHDDFCYLCLLPSPGSFLDHCILVYKKASLLLEFELLLSLNVGLNDSCLVLVDRVIFTLWKRVSQLSSHILNVFHKSDHLMVLLLQILLKLSLLDFFLMQWTESTSCILDT